MYRPSGKVIRIHTETGGEIWHKFIRWKNKTSSRKALLVLAAVPITFVSWCSKQFWTTTCRKLLSPSGLNKKNLSRAARFSPKNKTPPDPWCAEGLILGRTSCNSLTLTHISIILNASYAFHIENRTLKMLTAVPNTAKTQINHVDVDAY